MKNQYKDSGNVHEILQTIFERTHTASWAFMAMTCLIKSIAMLISMPS